MRRGREFGTPEQRFVPIEGGCDNGAMLFDPRVDITRLDRGGISESFSELAKSPDRLAYLYFFYHAARTRLLLPGSRFANTDPIAGVMKDRLMRHVEGRTLDGTHFFTEALAMKVLHPDEFKNTPLPNCYKDGRNCTSLFQFFNSPPFGGPFFLQVATEQRLTYPEVLKAQLTLKMFDEQLSGTDLTEELWHKMKAWQESVQAGRIALDAQTLVVFYGASNVIFDGKYPKLLPSPQEQQAMKEGLESKRRDGDWIGFVDRALWMTLASATEVRSSSNGIEIVLPEIERNSIGDDYQEVYLG